MRTATRGLMVPLLAAVAAGCRTSTPPPRPVASGTVRWTLGRVAVAVRYEGRLAVPRFLSRDQAALRFGRQNARAVLDPFNDLEEDGPLDDSQAGVLMLFGCVVSGIGGAAGVAWGAVAGEPRACIESIGPVLIAAAELADPKRCITEALCAGIARRSGSPPAVVADTGKPPAVQAKRLAGEFDALVWVEVTGLGLDSDNETSSPARVFAGVGVQALRPGDGHVLSRQFRVYCGRKHRLRYWLKDNAARYRSELQTAVSTLAPEAAAALAQTEPDCEPEPRETADPEPPILRRSPP